MAKPLPTADTLKSSPKFAELLRSRLQELNAEQQAAAAENPPAPEADPWLASITRGETKLTMTGAQAAAPPLPPLAETPPPPAPGKLSNSVLLQVDSLRSENARLRAQVRDLEKAVEELEQSS